jgi:lantibiotic modifying enzyme
MSSEPFAGAASAIGRRIVAEAIWSDGRCTWMGATSSTEYRPLGPLVYDGTAGVALFLAVLASATGEPSFARTAKGAIRHAVERAASLPPGHRTGLQAGSLGVALAAATVGESLGTEELVAGARAVLRDAAPGPPAARRHDVMRGEAGSLTALLGLAKVLGDSGLTAQAYVLGESLLDAARKRRRGWSWADPLSRGGQDLCGIAHGAGGIGWALLELFAATGDERFRAGAARAFDYERSWLDARTGTWPDLRRGDTTAATTATWCYGEAGIALSRLRGEFLSSEEPFRPDADISLRTTRRQLEAELPFAFDDVSLCHGAAGAADALLAAGQAEPAIALGNVLVERHAARGDWPCGVDGTTPGLFRGTSGIGWFLLRLHDPSIASPLTLPTAG